MTGVPFLSLAIWVPILGGLLCLAIPDAKAILVRLVALIAALAGLAVVLPLWSGFDATSAAMQFVERSPWIQSFSI